MEGVVVISNFDNSEAAPSNLQQLPSLPRPKYAPGGSQRRGGCFEEYKNSSVYKDSNNGSSSP